MQYAIQGLGVVGFLKLNSNLPINKEKSTSDAMFIMSFKLFNIYQSTKYSITLHGIFDAPLTLAAT